MAWRRNSRRRSRDEGRAFACGLCASCRRGDDMHCPYGSFPGINRDGGFADLLKTSARSVVRLDQGLEPKEIAALADAGLTAIHAVKKAIPVLGAGTSVVVIGAGGLGHIGNPVPAGQHARADHRDRPLRAGAGARQRGGRRPHGPGRRHPGEHRPGAHRRARGRSDHRLRRREGGDPGRDRDGKGRRLLLRAQLQREYGHPHDRRDQPRDQLHRQPRRHLHRPRRADDANRPRQRSPCTRPPTRWTTSTTRWPTSTTDACKDAASSSPRPLRALGATARSHPQAAQGRISAEGCSAPCRTSTSTGTRTVARLGSSPVPGLRA
jgi:Alcohol dehydrogenase GroES-like domain